MSIKEQKFSALDSFIEKGFEITFWMQGKHKYSIDINEKQGVESWTTGYCKDADTALTEALRFLRKTTKPKPK